MTLLELTFLGEFRVLLDGRPVTGFRSANAQALLVYLAQHGGRPIARDTLAALLWPDESEAAARTNLRQTLHRLRKALGDLDQDSEPLIVTTRQAVQMEAGNRVRLDSADFLLALDEGALQTAVDLYHGELLPGFNGHSLEFEAWLRQEREHLHRLAVESLAALADDLLGAGSLPEARDAALRLLELEPWHEGAHRRLMLAYALDGDRAAALAQFERCRAVLEDELGLEPAAETAALAADIRSGRVGRASAETRIVAPQKVQHNLPAETTPLIGREAELATLRELFAEGQRLVVLVGQGGLGKTRLAVAAGMEQLAAHPDGVYFVDLAPVSDAADIPRAMAAALSFQSQDRSAELWPQLLDDLRRRHRLLIVDNVEHLPDAAPLLAELLQTCPDVALLVTSRNRLNLAAAVHLELPGLDAPLEEEAVDALDYTAVQLFINSAQRVRAGFQVTDDNTAEIARICRLVDGVPLGLLLAAAWIEVLSPGEIAQEIAAELDFLAADLADLPPRQRSMQAVFERSWEMLSDEEKDALSRLTVFRGGFTREAAQEVAGANLRLLLALHNRSLVQRREEDGRYSLQELLRQFVQTRTRFLAAREEAALAHCRRFAGLVAAETERAVNWSPVQLPARRASERDNILRAWNYAVEHCLIDELAQLAGGVEVIYYSVGTDPWPQLRLALDVLAARGTQEQDPAALSLQLTAVCVRAGLERAEIARRRYEALLDAAQEARDGSLQYWVLNALLNLTLWRFGPDALAVAQRALRAAQNSGDETLVRLAELQLMETRIKLEQGEPQDLDRLQALLAYFEPSYGDSVAMFTILRLLATIYLQMGQPQAALPYARRGMNLAKGWRDLYWMSTAGHALGEAYFGIGQVAEARAVHLDVLEWHLAIGQEWQTVGFLYAKALWHTELLPYSEATLPLLAMVYHHPATTARYQQDIEHELPNFKAAMDAETFDAAWAAGRELSFEQGVQHLRELLSGP